MSSASTCAGSTNLVTAVCRRDVNEQSSPLDKNKELQTSSVKKNLRTLPGGRGRPWTREEELYLLETRNNKTPYKHIAAHLRKTELACRLHYHQMSYGAGNRRRRNSSISSSSTLPTSAFPTHNDTASAPSFSPTRSPCTPAESFASSPFSSPMSQKSASAAGQIHDSATQSIRNSPQNLRTIPSRRLPPVPMSFQNQPEIDVSISSCRLLNLYSQHKVAFWGNLANLYGPPATPNSLEQTFLSLRSDSKTNKNVTTTMRPGIFPPKFGSDLLTPDNSPKLHGVPTPVTTAYLQSHRSEIRGGKSSAKLYASNTNSRANTNDKRAALSIQALLVKEEKD